MGGKAIMVLFIGVVIISTKIFDTMNRSSADMSSNAEKTYLVSTAKNIAQTGVNMGLRQLANNRTWRTGLPDMDLMGGRVVVTASDTTFDGLAAVKVSAKSIVGNAAIQQVRIQARQASRSVGRIRMITSAPTSRTGTVRRRTSPTRHR